MELLFQVILLLALVKYSSKTAFFRHWTAIAAYASCAGLLAVIVYPVIITLESDTFEKLLTDRQAVSTVAVLVTIEAISGMMISIGMLDNLFSSKKQPLLNFLKYTPGILIFGAVLYFELALFRHFAGIRFLDLALICSLVISSGIFLAAFVIKKALPDDASRYELIFLTNILLLCLSILLNAGLADYNTSSYQAEPEYAELALFSIIAGALFMLGYILFRYRTLLRRLRRSTATFIKPHDHGYHH